MKVFGVCHNNNKSKNKKTENFLLGTVPYCSKSRTFRQQDLALLSRVIMSCSTDLGIVMDMSLFRSNTSLLTFIENLSLIKEIPQSFTPSEKFTRKVNSSPQNVHNDTL